MLDKLKNLLNKPDDEYDEDYELQSDEDDYDDDITPMPKYKAESSNRLVRLGKDLGSGQIKVCIFEPASVDVDSRAIVDSLKSNKVCIVNLEKMEKVEDAKTIFNFLKGAIYSMEGTMKKISKGIFVLAPNNTDVDGNIEKELESKGIFKWQ